MKHFILDVYNIIYGSDELKEISNKSFDYAINSFLISIQAYLLKHPKFKISFVVDGYIPWLNTTNRNIAILQSYKSSNADDVIRKLIKKLKHYGVTYLISSDSELCKYAKLYSIKIIAPSNFLKLLGSGAGDIIYVPRQKKDDKDEKPTNITEEELNYYKKIFE